MCRRCSPKKSEKKKNVPSDVWPHFQHRRDFAVFPAVLLGMDLGDPRCWKRPLRERTRLDLGLDLDQYLLAIW